MMFVRVAKKIAVANFVGPSHAATRRASPAARPRLIPSPATTGTSTSRPKAIMSVATETCCRSIPNMYVTPNVMARVMGIARAMIRARRHSQNPTRDTPTTRTIASSKARRNRWMFSLTCNG